MLLYEIIVAPFELARQFGVWGAAITALCVGIFAIFLVRNVKSWICVSACDDHVTKFKINIFVEALLIFTFVDCNP